MSWKQQGYRHSLAAKGIKTNYFATKTGNTYGWKEHHNQKIKSYFEENVKGEKWSAEERMRRFKKGVKSTVLHPGKDLDGEWQEYTSIANNKYYGPRGKPEKLSNNRFVRAQQRGAALFTRVVSQANMEMFIDNEKDRSLRESMMDFTFGRRL